MLRAILVRDIKEIIIVIYLNIMINVSLLAVFHCHESPQVRPYPEQSLSSLILLERYAVILSWNEALVPHLPDHGHLLSVGRNSTKIVEASLRYRRWRRGLSLLFRWRGRKRFRGGAPGNFLADQRVKPCLYKYDPRHLGGSGAAFFSSFGGLALVFKRRYM